MKNNIGIDEKFGEDEEQPLLVDAFQKLKPNQDPKNFLKMMKKQDNIARDTKSKGIVRKTQKKADDQAIEKNDPATRTFLSARTVKKQIGQKVDKGQDVEQILNVLELVNKEAIHGGLGGGLHGPASKMLDGINQVKSRQKQKMLSSGGRSFVSESLGKLKDGEVPHGIRYLSSYKAELIRHNVVTRTDLMRLYHPPLKQS